MRRIALVALALGFMLGHTASSAPEGAAERAELRELLAAERKVNLKRFHEYRRARVYPHNTYENGMLNVWRDDDGHTCAVATIMLKAGMEALVDQVAAEQNFVKLAEVTTGPLLDWVLTSGLTQEEIVMIQYPSWEQDDPVGYRNAVREQRRRERAREREDDRLSAGYRATERALKQRVVEDAGLDLAVARLSVRPDLVTALRARTAR
jgi:hypothetical protein